MDPVIPHITDDVADTLFINILMKCHEHRRKNGFYHDPMACHLVESVDYDFTRFEKGKNSSVCIALRAKYFDEVVEAFIRAHPDPVVVFVGCGLDPRFHRLNPATAAKAVFYELDLPEVIALREQLLPHADNDRLLPGSMLDTGWMDGLRRDHPESTFLFTMEGVCIYFEKAAVRRTMSALAARFPGGKVLFDATSSWLCRNQERIIGSRILKAPFRLALDDEREVETWADNIRLESCRYYPDFRDFRHTGLVQNLMLRLVPQFKKSSRIIACELEGPAARDAGGIPASGN
ncbi:MAG: class I SAM-dependent methyltransferase [Pseudodesulfovibrio sp.]